MKIRLLLFLISFSLYTVAQADSVTKFTVKKTTVKKKASTSSTYCILSIGDKSFESGWKITKEELLKLCTLQVLEEKKERKLQPVSFKWMINHKGEVFNGNYPADCSGLPRIINRLASEDIVFIEQIKCRETATLCTGQYVLIVK